MGKNQEEADTRMLFHFGYLVAPNNVVVMTANTEVLIIHLGRYRKTSSKYKCLA